MPKTKKKPTESQSFDGVYLLKLVLYVILGSLWLKASHGNGLSLQLPVGAVVALLFASHEHFRIDRKIEYAVIIIAMLVGYLAPYGLYVQL